jgi:ribosomal protein S12 methylthiotransferase accessory factor YcaO
LGSLATGLREGEAIASATIGEDVAVLEWMKAFELLDGEDQARICPLLSLLEKRVEAIVDATPRGSPITVLAAFESQTAGARRCIFSGRAASPQRALIGCLLEAVETIAARWSSEVSITAKTAKYPRSTERETLTVPGCDIGTGKRVDVPADRVFLEMPADPAADEPEGTGSNGLAAAWSYEEARLHAVLELIERDAVAIWWRNRLRVPPAVIEGFDPESLGSRVERWLRGMGRRLELLSLPCDLGAAVTVAVSVNEKGSRPIIGAAARLDPGEAVEAALGELIQMEANLSYVSSTVANRGIDALPERTRDIWRWHETESLQSQPFLKPSSKAVMQERRGQPVEADPAALASSLQRGGVDVSVVRFPEFLPGVSVVRAVSNSMADLMNASARLQSVPTKLAADLGPSYKPASNLNMAPVPL